MEGQVEKKREMTWVKVLWNLHLHLLGLYGFFVLLTDAKWLTVLFALLMIYISALGVTVGAHRLWAHQSFQAATPVRLFLALAHTMAGVGSIHDWVLLHRAHHKYYGTSLDPYNHKKGLWYSHVVSNLLGPHPEMEKFEKDIDMRDIESDGIVWTQHKFYWILYAIFTLLLPMNAPAEYWGESIVNSLFILGFFRLLVITHITWLINSSMLIWGMESGSKYPSDGFDVFFIHKSYWPNYHYLLPWDWKCGEYGTYERGFGSVFIKSLDILGLVDEMKTASDKTIREIMVKVADKKIPLEEALRQIKEIADQEALRVKHTFHH